jgi:hypothetical protein
MIVLNNFKTDNDYESFVPKLHFDGIIDFETLAQLSTLNEKDQIEILGTSFLNQLQNRELK